jgi:peptidoglycan hydrolase-like protein with peptidoglycan-binding domain
MACSAAGAGGSNAQADGAAATSAPSSTTTTARTTTTTLATTTTAPTTTTTIAPSTTTTAPPATTTTAPAPSGPVALPPLPPGQVLAAGSSGPLALALQQKLVELHFDPGPLDGHLGSKTTMAVWAFQHLYGLPADGKVDATDWTALASAGPPPAFKPDGGPTRVEVSIEKQVLVLYQGGAVRLITHISTGSGLHYCEKGSCGVAVTPRGSYKFQRRIAGWHESPLGMLFNPIYFVGGYAVHGAPSVPNHPASHGCVRIPMHIAGYFPSLVKNGDPIYVV